MSSYNTTDDFATIVPRITGSISTISSSLIIYLIFRSKAKLSTIYHRIMFGMSCADILCSIAMGLTTLPMPKDNIEHDWAGTRLGNSITCSTQGFFLMFGIVSMFVYNVNLCIYYACAIAFKMKEKNIVKYVEPILHFLSLGSGLGAAILPLLSDMYSPTAYVGWCTYARPDTNVNTLARVFLWRCMIFLFFVICLCFVLIFWRVAKTERELRPIRKKKKRRRHGPKLFRVIESHFSTKVLLKQALIYILSLLVLIFAVLTRVLAKNEILWLTRLQIVCMPLHGFFNALIFIHHKIYNYRKVDRYTSRCQVLYYLFAGQYDEPIMISRISMILHDENEERFEVDLSDEYHNEVCLAFDINEPHSLSGHVDGDEIREDFSVQNMFEGSCSGSKEDRRSVGTKDDLEYTHIYIHDSTSTYSSSPNQVSQGRVFGDIRTLFSDES